jgi:very-short-patch-repair endonuclease
MENSEQVNGLKVQPKRAHYKSFQTAVAKDTRLSYKARGVMFYLLSNNAGWKGQIYDINNHSNKDGIVAIRSAMKELVALGYAKLKKPVNDKGAFTGSYYEISDSSCYYPSDIKKGKNRAKKPKPPKETNRLTPIGKKYRKELAKKATSAEIRFKRKLSTFNFNFNFQKPFDDGKKLYIADFYIPLFGLVIELDGGYHSTLKQQEYDHTRNEWFEKRGYNVWRMTNEQADAMSVDEIAKKLGTYKRLILTEK